VIAELLRFLKRSYWPFAWDSSAAGGSGSGVACCPSSFRPPRTSGQDLFADSDSHRQESCSTIETPRLLHSACLLCTCCLHAYRVLKLQVLAM